MDTPSTDILPGNHTYPGINNSKANFYALFQKISDLSKELSHIMASWAGMIALAKMYLLPHILHLFCALLIPVLASYLKKLQWLLDTFICTSIYNYKRGHMDLKWDGQEKLK